MTVIEQLAEFIKDSKIKLMNNQWLQDDVMKVYVRKGRHMVYPGKLSVTLDIASVEVDEDKQGQGYWTEFLDKAHEMNPWEVTYVENILNPILSTSLIRHGWMIVPGTTPESFFMPKDLAKYFDQQLLQQMQKKFSTDVIY